MFRHLGGVPGESLAKSERGWNFFGTPVSNRGRARTGGYMKTITLMRKMLAPALLLGLAALLPAQVQDLGEGSMQVSGGGQRILPLKHTEVKAEISGFVAEVLVTQVFGNPADKPIEAVYVFPLPENAAVNEMTLTVAGRVIKGQIKKREEARQAYEQAKAQNKTTTLLDHKPPN